MQTILYIFVALKNWLKYTQEKESLTDLKPPYTVKLLTTNRVFFSFIVSDRLSRDEMACLFFKKIIYWFKIRKIRLLMTRKVIYIAHFLMYLCDSVAN